MRKVLLLTAAMMLVASLAFAQGGSVGIFADPGGTNCNVFDIPGLLNLYVVHVLSPCATALQFSAPQPACFPGIWLSDTAVYPVTIGNSQTGVAIGFGLPVVSPNNVLIMAYFAQGLTGTCCLYSVFPDPAALSGQIEVVDCTNTIVFATGGSAIINPDGTCQCNIANEETTWGSVKALYE